MRSVLSRAVEPPPAPADPEQQFRDHMRDLAQRGGRERIASMTPDERRALAAKAARARWAKQKSP